MVTGLIFTSSIKAGGSVSGSIYDGLSVSQLGFRKSPFPQFHVPPSYRPTTNTVLHCIRGMIEELLTIRIRVTCETGQKYAGHLKRVINTQEFTSRL